jgi:hypothetical protein
MALTACASRDSRLASAVVDTLPGGIPRVTSTVPTAWTDTSGWKLVELDPIAPAAGSPGELINPSSMAVDVWGRVYVADQSPAVIKLFDSAGKFIRAIGREGDGPGEFRTDYIAVRGNRLLVHDPRSERTNLFDTSGAFIRSFHSVGSVWDDLVTLDAGGRAVIPAIMLGPAGATPEPAAMFVRFDSLGAVVDTLRVPALVPERLWELRRNGQRFMTTPVPFSPATRSAFGSDSGVVYGATSDFSIIRSTGHGDTLMVMRRSWQQLPLPDSMRKAALQQRIEGMKERYNEIALRDAFHLSDIPTTMPAWAGLMVDDEGRTWVFRLPQSGALTFDILDASGAWLGPVVLRSDHRGASAVRVAHGSLYLATVTDEGLPVIRRWAIQDGQGGQVGQGGQE